MHSAKTETKYLDLAIPGKILLGILFALLFLIPVLSYA
ncbi:hypothetical protein BAC1_00423 [uncultured bacterium]|nr:hypothetical protein BAC1_00423 [uncultured bacterium]